MRRETEEEKETRLRGGRQNAELSLEELVSRPKTSSHHLHCCTPRTRLNAECRRPAFGSRILTRSTSVPEIKAASSRSTLPSSTHYSFLYQSTAFWRPRARYRLLFSLEFAAHRIRFDLLPVCSLHVRRGAMMDEAKLGIKRAGTIQKQEGQTLSRSQKQGFGEHYGRKTKWKTTPAPPFQSRYLCGVMRRDEFPHRNWLVGNKRSPSFFFCANAARLLSPCIDQQQSGSFH